MRGVHQVVAGIAPRDAITNHAFAAQKVLRNMGLRSEIYADPAHVAPALAHLVRPFSQLTAEGQERDVAILHYSIDSPAFDYAVANVENTAVYYHNVTPPELLWTDAPGLARVCAAGRQGIKRLAGTTRCSAAVSRFNALELEALGFRDTAVVGILRPPLGPARHSGRPASDAGSGCINLLFVGRGAPNKGQHDLILALGALVDTGVDAHLKLVGHWGGNRPYLERCRRMATQLGLSDRVSFLHSVSDAQLAREYARADVFLCLSSHEGFCVPLLEAMRANLSVVALDAGAVSETVGGAALLIPTKAPSLVAEATLEVLARPHDQARLAARQRQLSHHSDEATTARLHDWTKDLLTCS